MQANIINIATGKIKTYGSGEKVFQSAYKKDLAYHVADCTYAGIQGDDQADRVHHGDVDKAILIAAQKHLDHFEALFNKPLDPMAMGQNILIDALDENDICIGDIYMIGDVTIEVTQPRQPCWKIGKIFSIEVSHYIVKESATGWYVRVLTDGMLDSNDPMILKKRVSNITIKELTRYLNIPPTDPQKIDEILQLPALAKSYKDDFQKTLKRVSLGKSQKS